MPAYCDWQNDESLLPPTLYQMICLLSTGCSCWNVSLRSPTISQASIALVIGWCSCFVNVATAGSILPTNLQVMVFRSVECFVSATGLDGCKALRDLAIVNCSLMYLPALPKCYSALTKLALAGNSFDDSELNDVLPAAPHLRVLDVRCAVPGRRILKSQQPLQGAVPLS